MNCSRGCAWSKAPEADDPQKIQRELIWGLGDVSANQAVFCPLLGHTATRGPSPPAHTGVGQPKHPDASPDFRNSVCGFVLRNPQS